MGDPVKTDLPFNEKVPPPILPYNEKAPPGELEANDLCPGCWWGVGYQFTDLPPYAGGDSHGARLDFYYTNRKMLTSIQLGDLPLPVYFSPRLEYAFGSRNYHGIGTGMTVNMGFPDLLFFYMTPEFQFNWINKEPIGSFALPFGIQATFLQKPMFGAFVEYSPPAVMWGHKCPATPTPPESEGECDHFGLQKFNIGARIQF